MVRRADSSVGLPRRSRWRSAGRLSLQRGREQMAEAPVPLFWIRDVGVNVAGRWQLGQKPRKKRDVLAGLVDRHERGSRVAVPLRPGQDGERPPLEILNLSEEGVAVRHVLGLLRPDDGRGEVPPSVALHGIGRYRETPRYAAE
jgi:hypothetical protein